MVVVVMVVVVVDENMDSNNCMFVSVSECTASQ